MKSQAVASRKSGPVRRGASPSRQRKAAAAPPRSEGHERQAEHRGAQFVRGAMGLSRGLSNAPAAGFTLPMSVGEPLPVALRAALELAFNANFDLVRIHRDAPAQAAARNLGARAFTSGADMYFAARAYDPSNVAGRRLIAHEAAHVIQQAGRAAAAGRLRADAVQGQGGVQCEDDPNADSWVEFLASEEEALKALNARHAAAAGADDSLRALIDLVTRESGGKLPRVKDSAIGQRLIQIADDGGFEVTNLGSDPTSVMLTLPARGYLIDALKVCGDDAHFEAAAKLLDADKTFQLRSAFGPRTAFRKYLQDTRGEDWIARALAHPALARFWPGIFFNVFEQYAFNPGRPRQTLYGFKEARDEAQKNIDGKTTDLLSSDRVVMAFDLLDAFDQRRLAMMKRLDDTFQKQGVDYSKPIRRLASVHVMVDWLRKQENNVGSRIWGDALERMRQIADDAAAYWTGISGLRNAAIQSVDALGWAMLDGVSPAAKHVSLADKRFDPVKQLLQRLAQPGGLYGLDATGALTDLPDAAGYEKRVQTLARALGLSPTGNPAGNQLLVLQTELIAQYHQSAALDSEVAVGTGFLIWWLLEFQSTLVRYQAAKDADAKRGLTDQRLAHRLDVAVEIARFSQIAGWSDVLAAAARVVRGDDVPDSYLLVRGGWRIDESAELATMSKDFGGTPIFEQYPFTADNVARFFHADLLRQMSDAVLAQVDRVQADPKAKLDAEAVNKVVREAGRPWRCVPDGAQLILKPSELQPVGGKANPRLPSVFKLIQASKKTMLDIGDLAKLKHLGGAYYYSALRDSVSPLFVWIFPDIALLIRHLRFNEPFASALPDGDLLTDAQWMLALVQKIDAGTLRNDIDQRLGDYATGEEAGLELALREFTTMLRREHRQKIAGWLGRYAKDRSVTNFELPRKSVEAIDWFRVEARPPVDSSAQQALLVLSLGAELEAAFPEVRHAARIPPLFHYTLTEAVKFADGELAKADSGDATYRKLLKPVLYANPKAPVQDEQFKDFLAHRDQLQALAGRIETARKEIQESSGFLSPDGRTLKTIGYYSELEPGRKNAIEVEGDEWELVQVHQKFTYHPPLSMSAVTDQTAKPILKDGDGKVLPLDDRLLATFLVNGLEYELRANETAKLVKLSEALFYFGFSRSMENLAEGLEAGAMFMMDVMELIPAIGQELMIARLTAQTAAFVGVELPLIADGLKKDPVEFIKKMAVDLMDKYLTLDGFITFVMLNGSSPLDVLRKPAPDKQSTRNKPHGKLGRLLAMLRKLGMRVADAMQWLQLRVSGPVRSLQSSVATRPKLGWVLGKAVEIALWARDVIPPGALDAAAGKKQRLLAVLEQLLPGESTLPEGATEDDAEAFARGLLARIEAEVKQAGNEFKEQLEARLALLAELQLPGEIIPLESVIAFIIDFFLGRLGAKVRIAKSLLENTKPYQSLLGAVSGALADQARGTAVDPNKYWREYLLDKVEDRLVDARNQLVDTLYGLTDRVAVETGVDAFRLARPAAKKARDMGIQRTPFPRDEIELAPSAGTDALQGEVPVRGRLAELPTTAGQPLAVRVRRVQEAQFGHDFGHVRVHAGASSDDALRRMRADAATSGSHVFLRPGLDPERGEGARLLRHELTHVLQQTGARPLGRPHRSQAVPGRPGVGFTLDAMREAAADAMARADSQVAREPVDVMEGAQGVQPSLESTALHMLQLFTEIHSAAEFEHAADPKDKTGPVTASLLMQAVRKRLGQKIRGDFLPFAWPVAAHIAKHVDEVDFTADLPKVVAQAQKPAKGVRGKKPRTELDFDRLVTLMEAVIFAKSGIVMQIKAKDGKPPTLEGLSVTYIHLGWIPPGTPGRTPLWDEVLANSPKVIDGDDPKLVRLELFARLQAMGPDPFVWKAGDSEYRFSDDFAEAYGKWRAKRKPDLVKNLPAKGARPPEDPKDIPKFKNEYLNPTGQSGIGLRIGLHGGHAGLEKQAGMDRESHHMVQYLLVQFFRNDNSVKAWRPSVSYKGVKRSGGAVDAYEGSSAGTLRLQALDQGGPGKRGSAMPAILISADTHRRGQLHVEKESQWKGDEGDPDSGDGQGRATQGFAIRAEFQRNQVKRLGLHDDAPGWAAAVQKPASQDQLHQAMVDTYHWMYRRMMGQLETALQTRERANYRAVAARIPKALDPATGKLDSKYDLSPADMAAVFARAKRHTDEVMAAAGWPSP